MGIGRRDVGQRDLRALWDLGSIAELSDAELLGRFVSGREEVSDLAFEALLVRHGPMVLGTCRRLLTDGHDVEDAFQATFLVLVRRANAVRVKDTLGPWLHEVARRVALEARTLAMRRRLREDRAVDLTTVPGHLAEVDDTQAVIDEEIGRLAEKFRAAVVLCDLEGMTIEGAAHRLGWPSGTVRSRLARGRERLRARLSRRGLGPVPEALFGAPAGVPEALVSTTARLAVLSMTGIKTAGVIPASVFVLTQGVLHVLLWNRVKTTLGVFSTLLVLGVGAASTMLAAQEEPVATSPRPARAKVEKPVTYQLTGSVRLEGSGEPVAGAKVRVIRMLADSVNVDSLLGTSDLDGRYQVNLTPGQSKFLSSSLKLPVGYWAPASADIQETFELSHAAPIHHRDFVVRRGTVWIFQLAADAQLLSTREPFLHASDHPVIGDPGEFKWSDEAVNPRERYKSEFGEQGRSSLTLPNEGRRLTIAGGLSPEAKGDSLLGWMAKPTLASLKWVTGFRPDSVKRIERQGRGYRLTDDAGCIADLECGGDVEPKEMGGKLTIMMKPHEPERLRLKSLSGRVVDGKGQPIVGAQVSLIYHSDSGDSEKNPIVFKMTMSLSTGNENITDKDGRYLITLSRRAGDDRKPEKVSVHAKKKGFGDATSPVFPWLPGEDGSPQVVEPIRLEPGVALSGIVVDPAGKPAVGAWVSGACKEIVVMPTLTDDKGRFKLRDLPKDSIHLACEYGELHAMGTFVADGKGGDIRLQLQPRPKPVINHSSSKKQNPPSGLKPFGEINLPKNR